MPKVFVVVENNADGQPMWDKAEFRQLDQVIRPSHKLSPRESHDFRKEQAQNADRYHRANTRKKRQALVQ